MYTRACATMTTVRAQRVRAYVLRSIIFTTCDSAHIKDDKNYRRTEELCMRAPYLVASGSKARRSASAEHAKPAAQQTKHLRTSGETHNVHRRRKTNSSARNCEEFLRLSLLTAPHICHLAFIFLCGRTKTHFRLGTAAAASLCWRRGWSQVCICLLFFSCSTSPPILGLSLLFECNTASFSLCILKCSSLTSSSSLLLAGHCANLTGIKHVHSGGGASRRGHSSSAMLCPRSRVSHTFSIWSECRYAAVVNLFSGHRGAISS